MSHELDSFEEELKKNFSYEMELLPAKGIQNIVNHCGFSLTDLCKITKGTTITAGPKSGWGRYSTSFHNTIYHVGSTYMEMGVKKLRYVFCDDTRHSPATPYVVLFEKDYEPKLLRYLIKVDRLKAFL